MTTVDKFASNAHSHLKVRVGSAGIHFFNRITGMNLLVDEIQLPSSKWSVAPRQVSIALTNACDLACAHCYAPKHPAVLDFEQLKAWLVALDLNGCIGVGFGGGEPTLYPHFTELCSYTAKKTGLAVSMTTHAHHLSDQLLEKIEGNVHFIRVSMDGVKSTYESIRGKSFDVLTQRIKALSKIAPFGINFVVNSQTITDLDKAIELAMELECSEFLLLPEEAVSGAGGIDNDTYRLLQEWVAQYCGSVPLTVSEGNADGLPTCNPLDAEMGLSAFAHIDASGMLKLTSYDNSGVEILEDGVIPALHKLSRQG
ncbi:radical SAM protein [Leptothoe spongobia]|uniref:Radical SAM protein n=1 Tax=Leptothoe spongobia TAU-MAC 1115 TaxID=1967444 RepID=A0A947DHN4_9CYAN|nr:radical SAM protein [Leptothoe spongobia]MBT9316086.1 radical SAM protein [Leptothoe spongobia TAU-MAC 1115]